MEAKAIKKQPPPSAPGPPPGLQAGWIFFPIDPVSAVKSTEKERVETHTQRIRIWYVYLHMVDFFRKM